MSRNQLVWIGLIGLTLALAGLPSCGSSDSGRPPETVASTSQALVDVPTNGAGIVAFAGTGVVGSAGDGGPATAAQLNDPSSIAVTSDGTVYVLEVGTNSIRRINAITGVIDTFLQGTPNLVANGEASASPLGAVPLPWTQSGSWKTAVDLACGTCGPDTDAYFTVTTGSGYLEQVVDVSGAATRIDASQVAYLFTGVTATAKDRARWTIEALNSAGSLLSSSTGTVTSSAAGFRAFGTTSFQPPKLTRKLRLRMYADLLSGTSSDVKFDKVMVRERALPLASSLSRPSAIAAYGSDLYAVDFTSGYVHRLTGASPAVAYGGGVVQTGSGVTALAAFGNGGSPAFAWVTASGNVGGSLFSSSPSLYFDASSMSQGRARGVAVAPLATNDADVWFTLSSSKVIRRRFSRATPPVLSAESFFGAGVGFADNASGDLTASPREKFALPLGLTALGGDAWLAGGDALIADSGNNAIRRLSLGGSNRLYTLTLAGTGSQGASGDGGGASQATLKAPTAIAAGPGPDYPIYVLDRGNNRIRKVICLTPNVCTARARFNTATQACERATVLEALIRDDHNACTIDSCENVAIRHTPSINGTACDDDNLCNGSETCDGAGACQAGTALATDDSKGCTADTCDPATGVLHKLLAAGTPCATGDICAPLGACNGSSGTCPAGPSLPTDDANACTTDACGTSGITHTPKATGTVCKLTNVSSSNDGTCDASGGCVPTAPGATIGAIDRTLPTPPSQIFDDYLSANGGNQSGTNACVYDATHTSCVFVPSHMALVRGTVANASGTGLSDVKISVLNHPEFGSTTSQTNGEYFMVVNGGGPLTIRADKTGYLLSDRLVNPVWNGTEFAQDIRLIAVDGTVSSVTFASGGVFSGSAIAANAGGDTSPARQAAAYFPPGVTVTADGNVVTTADFRVTEFTVGSTGQDCMPANVAANTMYTYAAEFSLEGPDRKRYDTVTFTTPVMSYVTNFLNMAVGDTVPVGYYDRQGGVWKAMPNGRVISIHATTGAVSGLQAGDPAVTTDELQKLTAYKGKTLWRLPLSHFSPLDFNLGVGAPACETQGSATVCPEPLAAQATGGDDGPACGSCTKTGSIIDVERQVLRETFPLTGTPFSLNYSSENTLGYAVNKTLGINFENHPKHSKLKQFVVDLKVAGKRVANGGIFPTGTYPSWTWPKSYQATWDGRDQDGRSVQGAVTATLDVGAVYKAERRGVTRFGSGGGNVVVMPSLTGTRQDPNITVWTRHQRQLQVWDASALGFGGWAINAHHTFDPIGQVLYKGDGTKQKIDAATGVISLVAGSGTAGTSADGTAAASASFRKIESMAVSRDGEIFVAIPGDKVVRKINVVNGTFGTVRDYAGKTSATADAAAPDAGPVAAVGGYLSNPVAIAQHDDGRLVIADRGNKRIYEVSPDGSSIRTLAGRLEGTAGTCGAIPNDTPARQLDLCGPTAVAAAPDGSTYFVDWFTLTRTYVGRIDTSGNVTRIAGGINEAAGPTYYSTRPPGTRGDQITISHTGLAVDRNNTLWITAGRHVIAIPPGDPIRVYPILGRDMSVLQDVVDLAVFPNGDLLSPVGFDSSAEGQLNPHQIQRCTVAGVCRLVAGSVGWANSVDTVLGGPPLGNQLNLLFAVATGPDGSMYEAHQGTTSGTGWRVFRVAMPPVAPADVEACVYKVPAKDGTEYYCFDKDGRHKSTVNALTNGTIRTFTYSTTGAFVGLLSKIVEADLRETVIDRSTSGMVRIISPTGQTTHITLDGTKKLYATSITGAGTIAPTHDLNSGLLTALTDADQQAHAFSYDNLGRLQSDTDAAGGAQYLTRTETATGKYTVAVTTAMGKTDSFSRAILPNGGEERVFTLLNGLTSTTTLGLDALTSTELPDKTKVTQKLGRDPRWGMLAPYVSASSFTAGSTTVSSSTIRTPSPTDSNSFTDETVVTGATIRTYQRVYSNAAKTVKLKSPLGREVTYTLDNQGRVVSILPPGTGAQQIDFAINATTGRLDKVSQGTGRVVNLTYSASGTNKGFLTSVNDPHVSTDAAPLNTTFVPDANGRTLSSTRKSVLTQFEWTGSGRLQLLTPPGQAAHQLTYDARGILKTYDPPTLGGTDERTTFNLDLDRYLQSVDAPGSDDVSIQTDPYKGRVTSILVGGQSIAFGYYGPTGDASCPDGCAPGHVATITDGRSSTTTTFKWNKALPLSIDEAGGTVTWTYNNDIRRTDETFAKGTHSSKTTLEYDLDGLLTCSSLGTCVAGQAEKVGLSRDATSGRLTSLALGSGPAESFAYNAYGELTYQDSTPFRVDYQDVAVPPTVPRDASGRVKRRIERIGVGGASRTFNYTYDDHGRLWKVDGAVTSEYRYDNNGNRTYAKNSAGTLDGAAGNIVYDAQDRLTKYGTTTFDYSLKGDVYHRNGPEGVTTYDYDGLGALRSVGLADGRVVDYLVDGLGRRIGKKVNGVLTKQWFYGSGMAPLAEADSTGTIRMRFVYGSKSNVPDAVKTFTSAGAADKVYRIVTDQLGTPRVIFDSTGAIFEATEFDEFGIKLSDTNTAFELPFGFAGGLYDADTKLTRFGARDYDASIGRWVSKDPILFGGGQANLYVYVNSDPVNAQDPTGLRVPLPKPDPFSRWMQAQADAWFEIAGENWMQGDCWAAVGPAAMGALIEFFPYALTEIFSAGAVGVITRVERHGPPPAFNRHAHGWTGTREGRGKPWSINENGTPHDGNYTPVPKADANVLRQKGFSVPDDGVPR